MKRLVSLANASKALFALVLAAAVFGVVSAVQAAIPDSHGVIHGCVLPSGNVRVIDSDTASCRGNEAPLDWNQAGATGPAGQDGAPGKDGAPGADGAPGKDGVSPTVTQLASGDSHCAAGGAAITDASGNTAYVCSGATGAAGAPGTSFDGTYTSPNGEFGISVTDSGIKLTAPTSKVTVDGSSVKVESLAGTKFSVGLDSIDMQTTGGTSLDLAAGLEASAAGPLSLSSLAPLTLSSQTPSSFTAPIVSLGGTACGQGAARVGDPVVASPAGTIVSGSVLVHIC